MLRKLGLDVAKHKCNFILINNKQNERKKTKEDRLGSTRRRLKGQNIRRMSQDLDRIQSQQQGEDAIQLPFEWTYSFKLLGVILDCNRSFRQHFREMKTELGKRLRIIDKVRNATWGLECRILASTSHVSVESVLCYGLATTGAHTNTQELGRVDTMALKRAARRVAGTNITMHIESLMMLAGIRSARNHYALKSANAID